MRILSSTQLETNAAPSRPEESLSVRPDVMPAQAPYLRAPTCLESLRYFQGTAMMILLKHASAQCWFQRNPSW